MIEVMNVIANRLKKFRAGKGYNQEGMAKLTRMSQRAWDSWEENPPKALDSLAALAKHFNISADYFLCLIELPISVDTRKLPEGGSELLEYLPDLSDRARSELLAIAEIIHEEDMRWKQYGVGVDALESTWGADFAEQLRLRLATLTAELGSEKAAIAHIRAAILGEEPPQE